MALLSDNPDASTQLTGLLPVFAGIERIKKIQDYGMSIVHAIGQQGPKVTDMELTWSQLEGQLPSSGNNVTHALSVDNVFEQLLDGENIQNLYMPRYIERMHSKVTARAEVLLGELFSGEYNQDWTKRSDPNIVLRYDSYGVYGDALIIDESIHVEFSREGIHVHFDR